MTSKPIEKQFFQIRGKPTTNMLRAGLAAAMRADDAQANEDTIELVWRAMIGELPTLDMVLHCPNCGLQHVDEPDEAAGWTNPAHRSHLCSGCKHVWRPADIPTNGVKTVLTRGERDRPMVDRPPEAMQLRAALKEIHCWLVCYPIASAEDMGQSFEHMCIVAGKALEEEGYGESIEPRAL